MSSPDVHNEPVNLTQELQQTLLGYQRTAGGFFDLNQQYAPRYTDLNLQAMNQTLFGSPGTPGQIANTTQANTALRGADLADIQRYGRQGYNALMQANPGLAQTLGNANAQGAGVFGPGSLMSNLQDTAQEQLALGGRLSPEEQNQLDQASRSDFANRGMLMGNQSIASELLNRDTATQQRLAQRMGLASGVEQLAGQDRSYLNQLAGLNASIYDPSQQILGRGSSALSSLGGGGVGSALGLMGTAQTQNLFNPMGGNDAFMTNANAQYAANIANANNKAASNNSLIQGGAGLLSAGLMAAMMFSDERLKEDVQTLGKSRSGIPIKKFRYRGDGRTFIGAMADDVEKVNPEAVVKTRTGLKAVRYPIIDAEFYEVPTLGGLRKAA